MKCEDCQDAISSFLDDELDDSAAAQMLTHMGGCAACRAHFAETKLIRSRIRVTSFPEVPEKLNARILAVIGQSPKVQARQSWVYALVRRKVSVRYSLAVALLAILLTGWALAAVVILSQPGIQAGMPQPIITLPAVEAHGIHVSNENHNQHEG